MSKEFEIIDIHDGRCDSTISSFGFAFAIVGSASWIGSWIFSTYEYDFLLATYKMLILGVVILAFTHVKVKK